MEVIVRNYDPTLDDPYVYATWTKMHWYQSEEPISMTKGMWFRKKSKEIKEILLDPETHAHVASIKDAPYMILGYLVVRNKKIESTCIKKKFRTEGIDLFLMKSMTTKGFLDERTEENRTPTSGDEGEAGEPDHPNEEHGSPGVESGV